MNLDPETPVEDIRKKYKKLSILVHPDKNPDDKERAQNAFEIVNKAWKILEHDGMRKRCMWLVPALINPPVTFSFTL